MNKDSCRLMLAEKGLKNTKTRAFVLQILDQASSPMTVDEIFLEMKKNDSSINLSTVYRTLETLLKKAFVVKTNLMGDSRSRYDLNRMEHKHHLVCINCNRMISVEDCPIDEYAKAMCSKAGFELTGHRLEIYGVCSRCKKG